MRQPQFGLGPVCPLSFARTLDAVGLDGRLPLLTTPPPVDPVPRPRRSPGPSAASRGRSECRCSHAPAASMRTVRRLRDPWRPSYAAPEGGLGLARVRFAADGALQWASTSQCTMSSSRLWLCGSLGVKHHCSCTTADNISTVRSSSRTRTEAILIWYAWPFAGHSHKWTCPSRTVARLLFDGVSSCKRFWNQPTNRWDGLVVGVDDWSRARPLSCLLE